MQLNLASREDSATVISLLEQALPIDPQSSVAMSRFANAYATRVLDHMGDTKRSNLETGTGIGVASAGVIFARSTNPFCRG
jgi:hypothetical protein